MTHASRVNDTLSIRLQQPLMLLNTKMRMSYQQYSVPFIYLFILRNERILSCKLLEHVNIYSYDQKLDNCHQEKMIVSFILLFFVLFLFLLLFSFSFFFFDDSLIAITWNLWLTGDSLADWHSVALCKYFAFS